ncbi:MAG: tRNA uridine-5-carboxymethylaminomethyl(34) synthesis GTPase MnmE [Muribaculaceae bacterium]|nr:tRNA uridine-5-carboxymethylaminomethyl(34) synthesis GTPase MnmE [Muribaculaceae bacterium]
MTETICAISTPPGVGGIAVARVSGPDAFSVVQKIWKGKALEQCQSHTAHLGTILDTTGNPLDQALITLYRTPRSFTGENTVEISVHGSQYVQRELLNTLINAGARLAEPGEFTRRAYLSGNLGLTEAEAVADIIASTSRAAHAIAMKQMRGAVTHKLQELHDRLLELASLLELELDFSEEDVEFASREKLTTLAHEIQAEVNRLHRSFASGNAIKNGIPVAIVGPTNAGKSSLLNTLVGDQKAIVSDIHGTTRDVIEDTCEIGDYLFRFMDTAGLRETTDQIETIGISRSLQAIEKATIIIHLLDITAPFDTEQLTHIAGTLTDGQHLIVALNKTDLSSPDAFIARLTAQLPSRTTIIPISVHTGEGIDSLTHTLTTLVEPRSEQVTITNARHAQALQHASHSIARVIDSLHNNLSGDLIALDIRDTLQHLSAITATITSEEILHTIFSRFCIGK